MLLALRSYIWFYFGLHACPDILLTEISGVGKDMAHGANLPGVPGKFVQHGFEFHLIIAMVSEAMGHYEHTVGIYAGLRIIRLLEAFSLGHDA